MIILAPDIRPGRRHYRPEPSAARQLAAYRCARGHDFEVTFAAGAEPPQAVYCRCGASARRAGSAESPGVASNAEVEHERHRGLVRERRTPAERDQILAERLAEVAAKRETGRTGP